MYKFMHWLFKWKVDSELDIALVFCNRVAFIKYKEHTVIQIVNGDKMLDAPKYIEWE